MCNMIVIIGFYFNTHLDSDYLEFLSEIVEAFVWEGTYDQAIQKCDHITLDQLLCNWRKIPESY